MVQQDGEATPQTPDPVDPQGQSTPDPQVPPQNGSGQTNSDPNSDTAHLQDALASKSADELVKMYRSLEKKYGESSNEIGESRKLKTEMDKAKADMDVVLDAIYADPTITEAVKKQIAKNQGQTVPDTTPGQPKNDDVRRTLENNTINEFERRYGIADLPPQEKVEMHKKIGSALAEMLDPGGNKSYQQILQSISLDRLPKYLENAYVIANKDVLSETGRLEGLRTARLNAQASIGSIAGGSPKNGSDSLQLTPTEKDIAKKQGISEDKYLKRKKEIAALQEQP